ncbi:hypothetical protein QWJ34_05660 [Saccharibacillus sp. CPCC 101409]|nr:hypothetical protein [Saccharibacillus sp. CPCC 101409]MDO3409241.1 hypothetical protein [Saccharibacillus sp. CPCC 101409]
MAHKSIFHKTEDHHEQEGRIMVRELRTILFFTLGSIAVVVGLSFFM